jgi:hypothetical protein
MPHPRLEFPRRRFHLSQPEPQLIHLTVRRPVEALRRWSRLDCAFEERALEVLCSTSIASCGGDVLTSSL